MQKNRHFTGLLVILLLVFLSSCGPKSITTDAELLRDASKAWIPYAGEEQITFYHDTNKIVFTGNGKETFFDHVRYMSDQSGFFTYQEDYYADLERQELYFTSQSTNYFLNYFLEKGKGETGNWDILRLKIADGNYYTNDMKIVVYESDSYDKGEVFQFKTSITLNGNVYSNVYYNTQERRPFELYYTEARGIIGFKVSSNELWTIDPDTLD